MSKTLPILQIIQNRAVAQLNHTEPVGYLLHMVKFMFTAKIKALEPKHC